MALFKKTSAPSEMPVQESGYPAPPPQDLPIDKVQLLRQQGLTNNQIIQTLERSGYSHSAIYDALNQAELQNADLINQQPAMPQPQDAAGSAMDMAQQPFEPAQPQVQQQPVQTGQEYDAKIEELAEAIIDEKWNDLLKNINKIIDWKNRVETKLTKIEADQKAQKKDFADLKVELNTKIDHYDSAITEMIAQTKAVETVFKKILPTLVTTVNELSRLTKKIPKK